MYAGYIESSIHLMFVNQVKCFSRLVMIETPTLFLRWRSIYQVHECCSIPGDYMGENALNKIQELLHSDQIVWKPMP